MASLAFGSAGLIASSAQSQFVQDVAFLGNVVPQYGHGFVSQLISWVWAGASVYSIRIESHWEPPKKRFFRQEPKWGSYLNIQHFIGSGNYWRPY